MTYFCIQDIINIDIEMDDEVRVKKCDIEKPGKEQEASKSSVASLNSEQEQKGGEVAPTMDTEVNQTSTEDWTMINKDSSPTPGSSSPTAPPEVDLSIDDDIQVISSENTNKESSVYPSLPMETDDPQRRGAIPRGAAASRGSQDEEAIEDRAEDNRTLSSDEKRVADSLKYMKAMGYSDEGGWLTRLLELKKGNINDVLDVLMGPSKK